MIHVIMAMLKPTWWGAIDVGEPVAIEPDVPFAIDWMS
jgi:hypothetical protein